MLFRSTSIMAFLLAVIMGSIIIPGEVGRRTIYNTLSKPVHRWEYYIGKYLGIVVVLASTLLLTFAVLLMFIGIKFGIFNPGLAKALFTIFLESAILASVAMLTSIYLSPLVCIFLVGLFYVVCHVKGDFLYQAMTDTAHNILVRGLSGVGYYILPNLERLNINETVAHGERVFRVGAIDVVLLFGMALSFTVIFIFIGNLLFSRRDL